MISENKMEEWLLLVADEVTEAALQIDGPMDHEAMVSFRRGLALGMAALVKSAELGTRDPEAIVTALASELAEADSQRKYDA